MKIGQIENLKIGKIVDIGAYLYDEDNNKVLLPKKQVPRQTRILFGVSIGSSGSHHIIPVCGL